MDTITVAQSIAERVEWELERVKACRPGLGSRVERATDIVAVHLSCCRQRVIRVRVFGGAARFLVSGSNGAVYVVDPASWSCTCPDHHRRGSACKHALACWALARVGGPPARRAAGIVAEEAAPYGVLADHELIRLEAAAHPECTPSEPEKAARRIAAKSYREDLARITQAAWDAHDGQTDAQARGETR